MSSQPVGTFKKDQQRFGVSFKIQHEQQASCFPSNFDLSKIILMRPWLLEDMQTVQSYQEIKIPAEFTETCFCFDPSLMLSNM